MANKKEKAEDLTLQSRARDLRDIALGCYIYHNPHGKSPGWEELSDFSLAAWKAIASALIKAGWRPPLERKK